MPIVQKAPPPLVPHPTPQKLTREQAIARLLARGLTLAEIQAEEEQAAALHAIALLRALLDSCSRTRSAAGIGSHRYSRYRVPHHEPLRHGFTVVVRQGAMATRTKVLAHRPLRGKEPLGMAR